MPTRAFHTTGGPSLGHSESQPVSAEMPLRLGPRQCGQSSARAVVGETIASEISAISASRATKTPRAVPQVSKPAVSPTSSRRAARRIPSAGNVGRGAGWKPCDTADLEVCATVAAGRLRFTNDIMPKRLVRARRNARLSLPSAARLRDIRASPISKKRPDVNSNENPSCAQIFFSRCSSAPFSPC